MINAQNGTLVMKDENGKDSVILDARFGLLDLGGQGNEGDLRIRDSAGTFVFRFDANFGVLDIGGAGNEGDLRMRNDADAVHDPARRWFWRHQADGRRPCRGVRLLLAR